MRNSIKMLLLNKTMRQLIVNSDNEAALMTTTGGLGVLTQIRGTAAQSTDRAVSGTTSYKYTCDATNNTHYPVSIPGMRAGKYYRFTGYVYLPADSLAAIKIVDTNDGSFTPTITTVKDAWIPFDVTRPPKATGWTFGLGNNAAESVSGKFVYVEDFNLYEW